MACQSNKEPDKGLERDNELGVGAGEKCMELYGGLCEIIMDF